MSQRGSVSVVAAAVIGLMFGLTVWVIGVATVWRARQMASTAADAAALAAAPVTFLPFGAAGSPTDEATRFARLNGTSLVACECPLDPSLSPRTVTVRVRRSVNLPVVGSVHVEATARAEFIPARLLPGS